MSALKRSSKPEERRRGKRIVLTQQPKGKLQLYVKDQCLTITQIKDVSPFGACTRLDTAIDKDAQVRLTYAHGDTNVEVVGTVVWRKVEKGGGKSKSAPRSYWVGIFLYPGNMDANLRFYKSVTGLPLP